MAKTSEGYGSDTPGKTSVGVLRDLVFRLGVVSSNHRGVRNILKYNLKYDPHGDHPRSKDWSPRKRAEALKYVFRAVKQSEKKAGRWPTYWRAVKAVIKDHFGGGPRDRYHTDAEGRSLKKD